MQQMAFPFTAEIRADVMVQTLWAAVPGPGNSERVEQITQALRMTAHANPKIKGERLFLLTLEWLKTSRVVA